MLITLRWKGTHWVSGWEGGESRAGRSLKKTYTEKLRICLFGLLLPSVGRWKMQDRAWKGRQRPNRPEKNYTKKGERLKEKPNLLEGTRNIIEAGEKSEI